jgi:hypothetical protein
MNGMLADAAADRCERTAIAARPVFRLQTTVQPLNERGRGLGGQSVAIFQQKSRRRHSTILPAMATAFFVHFLAALFLMHIVRPDYTIVDHMISDYAVGQFGWIMTTAFISVALGCLTLGIGLFRYGPA